MVLIETRGLSLPPRLRDLSLAVHAGQLLGVIGPNGAGKSSLLHCLAGLLPYQGTCLLEGQELGSLPARQRARAIGLLPQACESAWSLSVEDVVALGRLPWGDADACAMEAAMKDAGIQHLRGKPINRISGGERSRVWLARVLAGRPRVLLADEPIASLDLKYQCAVMQALRDYADQGHAVIVAIHDLGMAARYCDDICLLQGGAPLALGRPDIVLTKERLSAAFQVPVHIDLAADPPVVIPAP